MASINFHENEGLDAYYDSLITYINQLYDYYPTNLIDTSMSKSEISDIAYYDKLGERAAQASQRTGVEEPLRPAQINSHSPLPRDVRWWRKPR